MAIGKEPVKLGMTKWLQSQLDCGNLVQWVDEAAAEPVAPAKTPAAAPTAPAKPAASAA